MPGLISLQTTVLILSSALAVSEAPTDVAAAAALLPGGGLIDPTGRIGYVASAAGGIEALDLATGDVLWQTIEAQRPLLIANGKLYAQAGVKRNRLRLLAFDLTKKGNCVLETDPVVLPEWVVTGDASGRAFTSKWRLDGNSVVLNWEASAWNSGAGKPTVKTAQEDLRYATGTARIDLKTGQVKNLPAEPPPPTPSVNVPKALDHKTIRWQASTDKGFKALVVDEVKGKEKLTLRTWNTATGKEEAPHEILQGKRLVVVPTLDEKFLCVRDAMPNPDEHLATEDRNRFGWSLFSVATGEKTSWFPYEAGTQGMTVHGLKIFVLVLGPVRGPLDRNGLQSRTLKVLDLKTGKQLWERALEPKPTSPPPPVRVSDEEPTKKTSDVVPAKKEEKKEEKKEPN